MNLLFELRKIHGKFYELRKRRKAEHQLRKNMEQSQIHIMTIDETFDELAKGKSIARFGDGEMDIIIGKSIGFQRFDTSLSKELRYVLTQTPSNCLIAVPDAINTFDNLTANSTLWWKNYMINNRSHWLNFLKADYRYANTNISRCYIRYKNKDKCKQWCKW